MSRPYSRAWWIAMAAVSVASVAVIVATEPAHAGDNWGDDHVKVHLAGEAALGTVAGAAIESKPLAFAVAMAPGLYREQWKKRHGHSSYSPSRLAADAVGAAAGVYTGHCAVTARSIFCKLEF